LKKGFEKLQCGENPNPVDPVTVKVPDTVDELQAKLLELASQLDASKAENARLSMALEEALVKT